MERKHVEDVFVTGGEEEGEEKKGREEGALEG